MAMSGHHTLPRMLALVVVVLSFFGGATTAFGFTVTTSGDMAVRIERESSDGTNTATVVLYGSNAAPSAAQLNGSWDTTGAGTWMGTTERARIYMDANDDAFEWYKSDTSPALVYILAHIFDAAGSMDAEVVTLGFVGVRPVYLANKPVSGVIAAATSTPVAIVNTSTVEVTGTVQVDEQGVVLTSYTDTIPVEAELGTVTVESDPMVRESTIATPIGVAVLAAMVGFYGAKRS